MEASLIRKLTGFGLIEVLIGVVVLSIGLLGLASLQNKSIQTSQQANNLVTAAQIAREVSTRMLTNPYITALGRQGYLALDLSTDIANAGGVLAWAAATETSALLRCYTQGSDTTNSCYATGATVGDNAAHIVALNNMMTEDQVEMRRLAAESLPDGEIKICFDSTNPLTTWDCDNVASRISSLNENVYTVKVRWTNPLSQNSEIYAVQFTAECVDGSATYCGN